MQSAVLILPVALKPYGDAIGEAMGWGPVSYTIALGPQGGEQTHVGLRADVTPAFVAMIEAALIGTYPPGVPAEVIGPVMAALVADFSQSEWGVAHIERVLAEQGLARL